LENTLEYAVTMTSQSVITDDLVLPTTRQAAATALDSTPQSQAMPVQGSLKSLKEARTDFEKAYLMRLMEICNGKASKAAEIAGKYRADFYDLLKKHEIKLADYKKSD